MPTGDVELTDAALRGLINNPAVREAAPSIKQAFDRAFNPTGCGSCARRAKGTELALAAARRAVVHLGPAAKARVRAALSATRVVVYLRGPGNRRLRVYV